jgi:hypothetical protein
MGDRNKSDESKSPLQEDSGIHYHDYLQLDKILGAQHPESNRLQCFGP